LIYLDSSALVKLAVVEPETDALRDLLRANSSANTTSEIAPVEVVRAVRIVDDSLLPKAFEVVAAVDLIPVSPEVLAMARDIDPPLLRTLDAIHLASAKLIGRVDLTAFVAYDGRLLDAARAAGLPTSSPGRRAVS